MKTHKKSQRHKTLANKNSAGAETLTGTYTSCSFNHHTPAGESCQFSELINLNTTFISPVLGLRPLPQYPLTAKQAWTLGKLAARIGRPRFWLFKEFCDINVDTPIPYLSKTQAQLLIRTIIGAVGR